MAGPTDGLTGIAMSAGQIAWLRGAYRLGRGDAMTAAGPACAV